MYHVRHHLELQMLVLAGSFHPEPRIIREFVNNRRIIAGIRTQRIFDEDLRDTSAVAQSLATRLEQARYRPGRLGENDK